MEQIKEEEQKAIRYLYGELEDAERDELEERLFTDDDFGLLVEGVENDLIDEYIRGELEFGEKRRFEKLYLNSESRRERVALARTLHERVFAGEMETVAAEAAGAGFWQAVREFFRFSNLALAGGLAVIVIALLLGGIWLSTRAPIDDNIVRTPEDTNRNENIGPPPPEEDAPPPEEETPGGEANGNGENEKPSADAPKSETQKRTPDAGKRPSAPKPPEKKKPEMKNPVRPVAPKPRIFIATLLPPLRSSERPVLRIPPATRTVRLQLVDNFGEQFAKFIAEISDGSGNTVWSQEIPAGRKRPPRSVTLSIPNSVLKADSYEIALRGALDDGSVEDINFYNFIVEKK